MEWLSKLFNAIKIPLKILLPAAWLFSGLMTFLPDEPLQKFSLLAWKEANGFVLGLIFAISSCLITVYIIFFIKEKISNIVFRATLNRKTMKRISRLDDTRLSIIIKMYNSPGYTEVLDYNEPIIKSLISENYIYGGGEQMITTSIFSNAMPVRFTLQPYVYRALDHYKPKIESEIRKYSEKIKKEKNASKKEKMQEELANMRENYNAFYNGGF